MNSRVASGELARSSLIATIDLNDKSIEALKEDLDTRKAFAGLLEVIDESNASAAFDFLVRNEKSHDTAFINAAKWVQNMIAATLAVEKGMVNKPYCELSKAERNSITKYI
jgi:Mn-containing catalase